LAFLVKSIRLGRHAIALLQRLGLACFGLSANGARGRHTSKSATIAIPREAPAAFDSTPRFEIEADCLCPVTDIEFAKQIA
jgi:hypothetical protein